MNRKQRRAKATQQNTTDALSASFKEGMRQYRDRAYPAAEKIFRNIVVQVPKHAESQFTLGNIYLFMKRHTDAEKHMKQALALEPHNPDYLNGMGKVLKEHGKLDEALDHFIRALDSKPDFADAHFQIVAMKRANPALAIDLGTFNQKYANPGLAAAYKEIGKILRQREDFAEAALSLHQAVSLNKKDADAFFHLAITELLNNSQWKAAKAIMNAIELEPDKIDHKVYFSFILSNMAFDLFNEQAKRIIIECLPHKDIALQNLAGAWLSLLLIDPAFKKLKPGMATKDYPTFKNWMDGLDDYTAFSDDYLILGLKKLIIPEKNLEKFFTHCRRYCLENISDASKRTALKSFLAALAENCFFNEYVFCETPEEKERAAEIISDINSGYSKSPTDELFYKISAAACYRPLFEWIVDEALIVHCKTSRPDIYSDMLRVQLDEPLEEREIRKSIAPLTPIENEISRKVREQYEENPYPRWQSIKIIQTVMDDSGILDDQLTKRYDVLIAGCGTGQQSLMAARSYPKSDILAMDLSLASLAYAIRKTKEYGVTNLTYRHGDILSLGQIGKKFDLIECTGVLHHMQNPLAGWQVLTDILKPGGYMRIGLYSALARQDVVKARNMVAEMGYPGTPEGIRACREEVLKGDRRSTLLLSSRDFYSLSSCRDLIFHVQEYRFTIPEIKVALQKLGLKFVKFNFSAPKVYHQFNDMFSSKNAAEYLDNWNAYEEKYPDTFAGMYQFWVSKG